MHNDRQIGIRKKKRYRDIKEGLKNKYMKVKLS